MKNIVIFGSSGHCKVIIDIIEKLKKYKLVGIIDKYQDKGKLFFDYEIIGWDDEIEVLIKNYNIDCGVIGVGDNSIRNSIVKTIRQKSLNLEFETLIHPKSNIGKNVIIGDGTVVMSGVSINPDTKIGNHCIINTNSSVDHDCHLGDYVSVSPNSSIGGNVNIGDHSFIGIGSNIINNINIGNYNIIGSSSLVNRDIGSYILGYGVPFKEIRKINKGEKYL
tara:strand:+ start:859 stop:1521 length:663 start_codon:yes stop_codon:yes gene_type:complete